MLQLHVSFPRRIHYPASLFGAQEFPKPVFAGFSKMDFSSMNLGIVPSMSLTSCGKKVHRTTMCSLKNCHCSFAFLSLLSFDGNGISSSLEETQEESFPIPLLCVTRDFIDFLSTKNAMLHSGPNTLQLHVEEQLA